MGGALALHAYCPLVALSFSSYSPLILLLFRPPAGRGPCGPVRLSRRAFGGSRYWFDRAAVVSIHRKFNFPTGASALECRHCSEARTAGIAYAKAGNHDLARAGP